MARVVQPKSYKGSQHWLQELLNRQPDLLNHMLRHKLGLGDGDEITWRSPLEDDAFAEYRDQAFLQRLGVTLECRNLASFWPSNGPQWDALGKTCRGDVLLVEAKAHVGELKSDCGACPASLTQIQESLAEAGRYFQTTKTIEWSTTYYQYANRLAHLYLLRELNRLPAWLIFLYFVNAEEVGGPKSNDGWRPAIEAVHAHLGITPAQFGPYVVEVFVDISSLANTRKVHQW